MKSNKKHILSNKNLRNIYNLKSLKRRRKPKSDKQQKSIMKKRRFRLKHSGGGNEKRGFGGNVLATAIEAPPGYEAKSAASTETSVKEAGILCCIVPTSDVGIQDQVNKQIEEFIQSLSASQETGL
jgi:hypothetical protein